MIMQSHLCLLVTVRDLMYPLIGIACHLNLEPKSRGPWDYFTLGSPKARLAERAVFTIHIPKHV